MRAGEGPWPEIPGAREDAEGPVELEEVVGLQEHVVEFEEGEGGLAIQPLLHTVEGQHPVDGEEGSERGPSGWRGHPGPNEQWPSSLRGWVSQPAAFFPDSFTSHRHPLFYGNSMGGKRETCPRPAAARKTPAP